MKITATAKETAQKLLKGIGLQQAMAAFDDLEKTWQEYENQLPELESIECDDGALLFELFISNKQRFGFAIEKNLDESGWFYVDIRNGMQKLKSGFIEDLPAEEIIKWITDSPQKGDKII